MKDTGNSLKPAWKWTQWMYIVVKRISNCYSSIFRVFGVFQWIKWLKNGPKSQENSPRSCVLRFWVHSGDIKTFPNGYECMYIVETSIPKLYFSSSGISGVIQGISSTKNYHTLTQNIFYLDIWEPGQHGTFLTATKECISSQDSTSKRYFSCFGLLESFRG